MKCCFILVFLGAFCNVVRGVNLNGFFDGFSSKLDQEYVDSVKTDSNNAKVKVSPDIIVFEAEATDSPLGRWKLIKKGDLLYDRIQSEIPPINDTYMEYTGGTINGSGIKPGEDVLEYIFTPQTSGEYRLTGRMGQRLTVDDKVARTDQCNDIFIKCEGDLSNENDSLKLIMLTNWTKFYGRGLDAWGTFIKGDFNKKKYNMIYNFKAGKTYKFSISGRSKHCCIDYFVFSKLPMVIHEKKDCAKENDERFRP